MRKEFRQILKQQFTEGLLKSDPGFTAMKPDSLYVFPRDVIYSKLGKSDGVLLFVILVVDDKREAFTIEVGWSDMGRFPELSPRPAGRPTQERTEFSRAEFVCRLGDLSRSSASEWLIQPDLNAQSDFLQFVKTATETVSANKAAMLVTPQVDSAIEQLERVGFPYLDEYVRSLG